MRVITTCPSRFAIFDQARELHRRGALLRLIHGYPKSYSRARGIPDDKVQTILSVRGYGQALWFSRSVVRPSAHERRLASYHRLWARAVACRLGDPADVFIGLSSFSLEALARARAAGYVTIIEHGSLHERFVRELLAEERSRGGPGAEVPSWPPAWLIEREDAEFASADYVSVQSQAAAHSLIAQGVPRSKIVVNPLAVDTTLFYPVSHHDDGVFRVVQCGAVSMAKGVQYLLRAFVELNLPRSELWLVGAVGDDMRRQVDSYGRDNIHLKGTYPQAELVQVYGQASVAVLASLADGFGMVVPQAMACGVPVIVTDHVGAADLVEPAKSGFVVPIRDVEQLKQHLLYLYEHPDARVAMGQQARAAMASGHTWDDYGERLLKFLTSVVTTAPADANAGSA